MSTLEYEPPLAPWGMIYQSNLGRNFRDDEVISLTMRRYVRRAIQDGQYPPMLDHIVKCKICQHTLGAWDREFLLHARKAAKYTSKASMLSKSDVRNSKGTTRLIKNLIGRPRAYRSVYPRAESVSDSSTSDSSASDSSTSIVTPSSSDDEMYTRFIALDETARKKIRRSEKPGQSSSYCRILTGIYMMKRDGVDDTAFDRQRPSDLLVKAASRRRAQRRTEPHDLDVAVSSMLAEHEIAKAELFIELDKLKTATKDFERSFDTAFPRLTFAHVVEWVTMPKVWVMVGFLFCWAFSSSLKEQIMLSGGLALIIVMIDLLISTIQHRPWE